MAGLLILFAECGIFKEFQVVGYYFVLRVDFSLHALFEDEPPPVSAVDDGFKAFVEILGLFGFVEKIRRLP